MATRRISTLHICYLAESTAVAANNYARAHLESEMHSLECILKFQVPNKASLEMLHNDNDDHS